VGQDQQDNVPRALPKRRSMHPLGSDDRPPSEETLDDEDEVGRKALLQECSRL